MMRKQRWRKLILLIGIFLSGVQPLFAQSGNLFNQLVDASKAEMAKQGGKLTIALEWTDPKEGKPVVEAFKSEFPFIRDAIYETLGSSANERLQRMLMEYKVNRLPPFDIMYVSPEVLPEFRNAGLFIKPQFPYAELNKFLPSGWMSLEPKIIDPEGYFIATTGLLGGILYNVNVTPAGKEPKTWSDCLDPMWKGKFIYDPRPRLIALQHDPRTRQAHMKWLKAMAENKPVLLRGQTEALEKVAAGEFPLFCGVRYHAAMKMIDDGAPLVFVLPDPFPLDFGTYLYVLKWSATPATTQLFALWLATKGQPAVAKSAYRAFPWSPNSRTSQLAKSKYAAVCDLDCLAKAGEYAAEHAKIIKLPGAQR